MNSCGCNPSTSGTGCGCELPAPGPGLRLAIATVPMQPWETPYDSAKALRQGTIFPSLDLPFFVTGGDANADG